MKKNEQDELLDSLYQADLLIDAAREATTDDSVQRYLRLAQRHLVDITGGLE